MLTRSEYKRYLSNIISKLNEDIWIRSTDCLDPNEVCQVLTGVDSRRHNRI